MKKMILFLLLVLTQTAFGQWEECNNGLNDKAVNTIFVSGSNIYAGVNIGRMQLSTNNGDSWEPKNNGLNCLFVNAILQDGNNLYAGTNFGVFLSTDGANLWEKKSEGLICGSAPGVISLALCNKRLFAGTSAFGLYRSGNNGETWTEANGVMTEKFVSVLTVSGNLIFAGTWGDGLYVSSDYGSTWKSSLNFMQTTYITSLTIINNKIFAGTSDGLYVSTNNGVTWVRKNADLKAYVNSMIASGNNYFISMDGFGVYLSTNGGDSWILCNQGLTTKGLTTLAISGEYLFVATSGWGIFRAKIADLIYAADVNENLQPGNDMEIQPNPATENITISLNNDSQPIVQNGSISIYNSLGIEIKRFTEIELAGQNSIIFSTEGLANGIYYCTYSSGTENITKSFIVLR